MGIEKLHDNIAVVHPSNHMELTDELATINEMVSNNGGSDIIVDFSQIEIITSSNICNLMILHKMLNERNHRLLLCNVSMLTKCTFVVTGLDKILTFVKNRAAAMSALMHNTNEPC